MDLTTTNGLIFSLAALVVSNIGMWVREWQKNRETKKGNGAVYEIKSDVKAVKTTVEDLKSGQIVVKEQIINLKDNCVKTTSTFAKDIIDNRKEILNIIKEKKGLGG